MIRMAEKKVKCPVWQAMNVKSETIEYNKRYYCKSCYEVKTAPKKKTEWDYLYETIKKHYGAVTPLMFKQLKDYREQPQYKFTDAGMRLTLVYYHEVLGRLVEDKQTLGIIPFMYHKAKAHYSEVYRLETMANLFVSNEQREVVKIVPTVNEIEHKAFDFDGIDWEEDLDE